MQYLEILLQIGQHFVSVEQRDYLIPTQLILLSILLDAERKEIGDIEFFIFHAYTFGVLNKSTKLLQLSHNTLKLYLLLY